MDIKDLATNSKNFQIGLAAVIGIALLAFLLLIFGANDIDDIKNGMHRDAVYDILGPPDTMTKYWDGWYISSEQMHMVGWWPKNDRVRNVWKNESRKKHKR